MSDADDPIEKARRQQRRYSWIFAVTAVVGTLAFVLVIWIIESFSGRP